MRVKIKITRSENASYYGVSVNSEVDEDLEVYVAAVVASEIGNAPFEACKAQAVASRTFAYRYILKDKVIPDSSSAQAFRIQRYSDSYKVCKQAAEATKGQVLMYKNSPIDSYFCHSNGGMIVSSKDKWGGARDYLVNKPDPWDAATHADRSGHGVGMSQIGAKYAANQGISYKEILSFYYQGTSLTKIKEKEETSMVSLAQFLDGCKRNSQRIKGYQLRCTGANGLSDCIGYVIGALQLAGQKWNGTHGSNYAARYRTKNLHKVTNASQLKLGELVYKHNDPGTDEWKKSFPSTYKNHPDQNDYYHVGVVTSVNPLEISHCSGGGMHYDKKLGKWDYAGECSLVDYGNGSVPAVTPNEQTASDSAVTGAGKAIVDVPDDTTVNIRSAMSTSSKVLVKANEGTELNVLAVNGSWAKVEYSFNKVGTGYVMSKFISPESAIDVPNDTTVNVRAKASINSNKLTTLPEGNKVTVLSKSGEWSKIEYSEPKKGIGYVMSKYLKKG